MKKKDLSKLALAGLSSGLILAGPIHAVTTTENTKEDAKKDASDANANDGNLGYHVLTEEELMMQLNEKGRQLYNSLSPEGKQLALRVASTRCNATNECRGLNACATEKNDCAGKGECKGQGKCAFADKNLAVKVVADKMSQKRSNYAK